MRVIAAEPAAQIGFSILLVADNDDAGGFCACIESRHASIAAADRAYRQAWGILRLPPAPPPARPGPPASATLLEA